jgi:crotonobetainyl-CoA:carnitine CoA-transferase CaiB-like acyl-CoA transferase
MVVTEEDTLSSIEEERPVRPLSGVRVLDLTRGMPGSLATMVLADYGAEVVMMESPRGSPLRRTGAHSLWNRGKRSLVVDLQTTDGQTTVRSLAAGADIVIEDHRPGTLATFSLSYGDVSADNSDVVYTSISAYGQTGSNRDRNGYDAAVAAHLGIMNEWGGSRDGPIFLGHPAIDYATALLATIGTLACLRSRLVSGHGDHVDVSMLDGALSLYPMNWYSDTAGKAINRKSDTGDLQFGNKRLLLRVFECSDGRLIQIHTGAAGAFDRAMAVFGLADEVTKTEGDVQMASLLTDRDLHILETRLPEIMRGKPLEEWLELLWANEVAALPIGMPGEALDDNQVRHAGIVAAIDDPALGSIETVGPCVLLSESPGAIVAPAPRLDQDGAAIRSTGWSSPGVPPVAQAAPLATPLEGIHVVEFATFFAAPYGHRLLSDLGADVIKVEAVAGDPMRPLAEIFEGANRGKRSIAADLKHPAAKQLLRDLLARADVVQHNLRPGVAERLGIDEAAIRQARPDVVYHYSPGYGSSGPKSMLQSFAPLVSGFVGQFVIGAGKGNRPRPTFGNEDYYNGLLGACACLLGLVHRERTGTGQNVESPQLHSSVFTTSEYYKRDGRYETVLPRLDRAQYGWSAGYRIYQCLDAWICVTCVRDAEVVALVRAVVPEEATAELTKEDVAADAPTDGRAATLLEYHFVERFAAEWVEVLAEHGVLAEAVREESWMNRDAYFDTEMLDTGRVLAFEHPSHGGIRIIGDLIRPSRQSSAGRGRAPLLGEHTREVLTSLGYDDEQIESLVSAKAVGIPVDIARTA